MTPSVASPDIFEDVVPQEQSRGRRRLVLVPAEEVAFVFVIDDDEPPTLGRAWLEVGGEMTTVPGTEFVGAAFRAIEDRALEAVERARKEKEESRD